ncbi:MAG: helix-turn-helix transcriptional regulator, partial [Chloroflexi bacterium]
MNSVGERLKQARTERGMTQAVLAQGLATKGFISLVERDLANCSLPKLRLFADRLGRPLSYFLPEAPSEDIQYLSKTAELALRAGETRQALKAIQEGLQLEITASVRAGLLRLRGMALFAMGRWERALGELQAAAAQAPADDPELTAAIYTEMGAVLGSQERYTASIEANMRALSSLDRSKHADPDLRARVLTNLANDSYHLGQLSDATTYLERALRVAMDAESLVRMANAHMALGITARASGDFEVALKHCDRALAIHHLLGHEQIANHILNNLA